MNGKILLWSGKKFLFIISQDYYISIATTGNNSLNCNFFYWGWFFVFQLVKASEINWDIFVVNMGVLFSRVLLQKLALIPSINNENKQVGDTNFYVHEIVWAC